MNANVNDKTSRTTNCRQRKHENIEAYIRDSQHIHHTITDNICSRREKSQHMHNFERPVKVSVIEGENSPHVFGFGFQLMIMDFCMK